jgi:hypothetical protein
MKTVPLRELRGWPPEPGGAYDSYARFPRPDEAVVAAIFPVVENQVIFTCESERRRHSYHYFAPTEKIATQVHDVVSKNLGKILSELGDFYIEIEAAKSADQSE